MIRTAIEIFWRLLIVLLVMHAAYNSGFEHGEESERHFLEDSEWDANPEGTIDA